VRRGSYVLDIKLNRACELEIGRLGRFRFRPGPYFYVGSAMGGLDGRLARHARGGPLRWHVDYLLTEAKLAGAWTVVSEDRLECRIARALSRILGLSVPRFGASDCRCPGHLFHGTRCRDVGEALERSAAVEAEYWRP
jgi:sugar fermentation stimulation protein A